MTRGIHWFRNDLRLRDNTALRAVAGRASELVALFVLEDGLVREAGVSRTCAARMVRLYGTEARELARAGTEPLLPGAPVLASEVDWAVRVEGAATVEDVLYRRLRTALYVPGAREAAVEPAVRIMQSHLDWPETRARAEAARVRERLAADLAFQRE